MVHDRNVIKKFLFIEQSALKRGLDFDLSIKTVRALLNKKTCAYTGVTFSANEKSPSYKTFDRVDNTKGYVDGNVVACTRFINELKDRFELKDLTSMISKFQKYERKRQENSSSVR